MKRGRKDKYLISIGDRFGRWQICSKEIRNHAGKRAYECYCDCGSFRVVARRCLLTGKSNSCGCYNIEMSTFHGGCGSNLYRTYQGILTRCYNKKSISFKNYGGRGIEVCNRWLGLEGFKNFRSDIGEKQSVLLSIDRIDNDGNYEPGNCRWATRKEQAMNTRRNKLNLKLTEEANVLN